MVLVHFKSVFIVLGATGACCTKHATVRDGPEFILPRCWRSTCYGPNRHLLGPKVDCWSVDCTIFKASKAFFSFISTILVPKWQSKIIYSFYL
ncbi:hypothetical protein LguiB_010181 [Lonicera macranthoides]